jgi:hypothetical protein
MCGRLLKISGRIYCNGVAVLDNRVQKKIFGPKRDEVTGEWKRPRKEELYDLVKVKAKVNPTLYKHRQALSFPGG